MAYNSIWTTEIIQQNVDKLRFGMQANMECFHATDIELKAGRITFKLIANEVLEFNKCAADIVYFVEKYCRFMTDTGRIPVKLRSYQKTILRALAQEEYIDLLEDFGPKNRNLILMASRQTGKTTTISAFFAWYLCFHTDRNLAILANKQTTAIEIVAKVADIFRGLPFFLKPGMNSIAKMGMTLDNGCQLFSQATTKTAQIGFTIHVLYADEFAHIPANIARAFWKSVYPTLASSNISQCIISSTPAGQGNLFFEIWDKAMRGISSFMAIRVDYWEVPEHDIEWANKTRIDFGEEEFAQEFELQFDVDSRLLLNAKELGFMKKITKEYIFDTMDKTDLSDLLYRNLRWKPGFDINADFDLKTSRFAIAVDLGEGKEDDDIKDNDSNVLAIFKIEPKSMVQLRKLRKDECNIKNMFRFNQVGLYRDNFKDEENCAKVCKSVVFDQMHEDMAIVAVEMNFNGKLFLNTFQNHDRYNEDVILHTYHTKPIPGEKPPRKKPGFKVTIDKDYFCKLAKKLIGNKTMIPNDFLQPNQNEADKTVSRKKEIILSEYFNVK